MIDGAHSSTRTSMLLNPLSTRPLHLGMRRQDLEEVFGDQLRRLPGSRWEEVLAVNRSADEDGSNPPTERLVLTVRRGKLTAWYRVKGARAASDE